MNNYGGGKRFFYKMSVKDWKKMLIFLLISFIMTTFAVE